MLKSMTGFGRGEYVNDRLVMTVEIKAVNHRYNEMVVRLPRILNPLEDKIRKCISEKTSRGRFDIFVNLTDTNPGNCEIKVDKELLLAYNNALNEIATTVNIKNEVSDTQKLFFLARSNGVINTLETQNDAEFYLPFLMPAVDEALNNLLNMRIAEGLNIYNDLIVRVDTLVKHINSIEDRAPVVVEEFHEKIRTRIGELLKDYEQAIDPDKLIHEVAVFADKTNITEEIVRFKSHVEQFKDAVNNENSVGRRLDFIVQEFVREVNTMASKANDALITQITIELKSEIEKIREQIQNIE